MPSSPSSPVRNATLAPKDVKEWLLPEPSSIEIDETVGPDRKSTRLNSSHSQISDAVFCLKKKKYSYIYSNPFHKIHVCLHENKEDVVYHDWRVLSCECPDRPDAYRFCRIHRSNGQLIVLP